MNSFLENYFKMFALFFTVLTSLIFITYILLRKKIVIEDENTRLNIASTSFVSVYEVIHIICLIYTANNVILKPYTIFLIVSMLMLLSSEALYIVTFIKLKKDYKQKTLNTLTDAGI